MKIALLFAALCASCQIHLTNTSKVTSLLLPECAYASDMTIDLGEARLLEEQSRLAHLDPDQRARRALEAEIATARILGHEDYMLVAKGSGRGNEHSNRDSIRKALAERAKKVGAELVIVVSEGVDYSTTAYQTPGSITGSTYYPGLTFGSARQEPTAEYLMYRRIDGEGQFRSRLLAETGPNATELWKKRLALLDGPPISIEAYIGKRDQLSSP